MTVEAVSGTVPVPGDPVEFSSGTGSASEDKDMFLKLLVAQMKYQDPANPASSSEFMAQTATFTQVEKLEEIAAQNASLLALQRSTSAGALVGRTVTYTSATGASVSGVATSVRLGSDTSEAVAMVGGVAVEMGRITEVAT